MEYTITAIEKIGETIFEVEDENKNVIGIMHLQNDRKNRCNGAFKSKELEILQNSIKMFPESSYVHNIYIEKKEIGNIYKSRKRKNPLTEVPCRKMYLQGKLYYGYEIYLTKEELVIPVYKSGNEENCRNKEIQVGLIRQTEQTHMKRIYKIYSLQGEEMTSFIMALYEYMLQQINILAISK